jgi:hypothetical protein
MAEGNVQLKLQNALRGSRSFPEQIARFIPPTQYTGPNRITSMCLYRTNIVLFLKFLAFVTTSRIRTCQGEIPVFRTHFYGMTSQIRNCINLNTPHRIREKNTYYVSLQTGINTRFLCRDTSPILIRRYLMHWCFIKMRHTFLHGIQTNNMAHIYTVSTVRFVTDPP